MHCHSRDTSCCTTCCRLARSGYVHLCGTLIALYCTPMLWRKAHGKALASLLLVLCIREDSCSAFRVAISQVLGDSLNGDPECNMVSVGKPRRRSSGLSPKTHKIVKLKAELELLLGCMAPARPRPVSSSGCRIAIHCRPPKLPPNNSLLPFAAHCAISCTPRHLMFYGAYSTM